MGGARGAGRRRVRVRGPGGGRVRDRGAVQRHVVVVVRGVGGRRRARAAADGARGVGRVAPRQPQGSRRQGAFFFSAVSTQDSVPDRYDLQLACELFVAQLVTCNSRGES